MPVTATLDLPIGNQHPALLRLHDYLAAVCGQFGIGLESCAVDEDSPVSAYVALDVRLPRHPDRDLALLWDERHGWSLAIETHSGEDLLVLGYLGGPVAPPPERIHRFVAAARRDGCRGLEIPDRREAAGLDALAELLRDRTFGG